MKEKSEFSFKSLVTTTHKR